MNLCEDYVLVHENWEKTSTLVETRAHGHLLQNYFGQSEVSFSYSIASQRQGKQERYNSIVVHIY